MEREIPPQAEAVDALSQAASVVPALVEQFAGGAASPRAASAAAIARIERLLRAARSPARSAALTRDWGCRGPAAGPGVSADPGRVAAQNS